MNRLNKSTLIIGLTAFVLIVLLLAFISPIAVYLVQKYDEKYTGRQIKIDGAYVNPFTGYLHLKNVKIYEYKSDSVFLTVKSLKANFEMWKLFSKTYELSELVLDHPRGAVLQHKKEFNFNDLIEKFSPPKKTDTPREPLHLNILNIEVKDGEFHYIENVTPVNYFIKQVNLKSTGIRWDSDTIPVAFSFLAGPGSGDMKGNFTINQKNNDYLLQVKANNYDLNIVGQYIKDLADFGNFRAFLNADFKSEGNLVYREDVTNSGYLEINDFHFGKNVAEDYASFNKLAISIHEMSPLKHIYFYDSVSLSQPYFKYERYDYLDNIQTMFGKGGSKVTKVNANPEKFNLVIEIAKYIKVLSKNFLRSNYRVDRVAIYSALVKYNDYSLTEKFAVELDPFTLIADSLDKTHKRVDFAIKSGIRPYGAMAVDISVNPKDSSDFDLNYHFQKLPATVFNPYILRYSSFQLDRGTIELKGSWHVRNGAIKSDNHLLIIDPRLGERVRNEHYSRLPLHFLMFVIRERGNVIDYSIPISGNLKDPKFHFKDVILDALANVFVKPATTSYRSEVRNAETEIETSMAFKWEMKSTAITDDQERFLEKMASFLKDNPQTQITILPQLYSLKEKEYVLFYEAKKRYFIESRRVLEDYFLEDDSLGVEAFSVKDTMFQKYLNKKTNDPMLFTIQDKCLKLVGTEVLNKHISAISGRRAALFMNYFSKKDVAKQVRIQPVKSVIPYNGFSIYKITYKNEFPEYVLKAYRRMNELNQESPRKQLRKLRKRSTPQPN